MAQTQVFLKVNGLGVKLCPCSWVCLAKFILCAHTRPYTIPAKRKWSKSNIQTLHEWKRITDEVFGPVVKDINTKTTKRKQTNIRSSAVLNSKEKGQFSNDNSVTVENGSMVVMKLTETNEQSANWENFVDSDLFDSSNYSETKLLSSVKHEATELGTSQGTASKPAGGNSNSKEVNHSLYSFDVGNNSQQVSFLVDSNDTTDYQWVDQSSDVNANMKMVVDSITTDKQLPLETASFRPKDSEQMDITCSEMAVEVKSVNVCSKNVTVSGNQWHCIKSEHKKISFNDSKSAQPSDAIPSGSVQCNRGKNSPIMKLDGDAVLLASVMDNTSSQQFSENFIMSFPLFILDSKNEPSVSNSKNVSGRLPSVTKILQATQPQESRMALERWEKQMIAELGEAGFAKYRADVFANGTNLHSSIERYLIGQKARIEIRPGNEGHWQSIEPVLCDVTGVRFVEHTVRHTELKYSGIVDCIAEYRGQPCVIEWKTSQRRKPSIKSTFDNPLQLVAYLGAYNFQSDNLLKVEQGVLVIGYGEGDAADVHVMKRDDCMHYWSAWLRRLCSYYRMGSN